jgi:bifunctional DNA-binding transcriptional regulator/antitoxin component of YhaV-PrlF toxin-antitoxin module
MTTTVAADNTVKIPDALARLLDLKPGTALDWQVSGPGSLLVRKQSPRGERADRLLGIGRPFLKPGDDPVAQLVAERIQDDLAENGPSHPRP